MDRAITLDLITKNVNFTWHYSILLITYPIILGSDFLDTPFMVLDIGNCTITLCSLMKCSPPALAIILYTISTL